MERKYQRLQVWQEAMELVIDIYRITGLYPDSEKFGLISQMRRAAYPPILRRVQVAVATRNSGVFC